MLTGNREFNESYENYKNLILRTAYTYSGNREAAEDITQETFLKLYIGYDSMKKENIPSRREAGRIWTGLFCRLEGSAVREKTCAVYSLSGIFSTRTG